MPYIVRPKMKMGLIETKLFWQKAVGAHRGATHKSIAAFKRNSISCYTLNKLHKVLTRIHS